MSKSDPVMASFSEVPVHIPANGAILEGDLSMPSRATGLVVFAHGSGSSRHSPRNRRVARALLQAGLATLLFDLLTIEEEMEDVQTAALRFDIPLLAGRLVAATDWLRVRSEASELLIGYFGASTGAAAALVAAAESPEAVSAVVSRGGRPDLAARALPRVKAPTLLIVGGSDYQVIEMNRSAIAHMTVEKELVIVPGATHLFEEPGAMEQVSNLARDWFLKYLGSRQTRAGAPAKSA